MSVGPVSASGRAAQYVALAAYLVFLGFPLLWLLSTSFKSPQRARRSARRADPAGADTVDNFTDALDQARASSGRRATASIVALATTVLGRRDRAAGRLRAGPVPHRCCGRSRIGWILVSQVFPVILIIIPLFLILQPLHLTDTPRRRWSSSTSSARCRSRCGCCRGTSRRSRASSRRPARSTARAGSAILRRIVLPLLRARPGRDRDVHVHLGVERVLLRAGAAPEPRNVTLPAHAGPVRRRRGPGRSSAPLAAASAARRPSRASSSSRSCSAGSPPACCPARSRDDAARRPAITAQRPNHEGTPDEAHPCHHRRVAALALAACPRCATATGDGTPRSEPGDGPGDAAVPEPRLPGDRPSRRPRRSSPPGTRRTRTSRSSTSRAAGTRVHDQLVTQFQGGTAPDIIHVRVRRHRRGSPHQGYLADLAGPQSDDASGRRPRGRLGDGHRRRQGDRRADAAAVVRGVRQHDAARSRPGSRSRPATPDLGRLRRPTRRRPPPRAARYGLGWGLKSPTATVLSLGLNFDGKFFEGTGRDAEVDGRRRRARGARSGSTRWPTPTSSIDPVTLTQSGSRRPAGLLRGKYAMTVQGNYQPPRSLTERRPRASTGSCCRRWRAPTAPSRRPTRRRCRSPAESQARRGGGGVHRLLHEGREPRRGRRRATG